MGGEQVPEPPLGRARLLWLGPGFLWMVSAAGSGELLFTPRVGSLYGYTLVWALIAAVTLKWFINREVGRFTVCTGETIMRGFQSVPGPGHWALWLILVPQVVVAIATIAGLASAAATALVLVLPGSVLSWTAIAIGAAAALVVLGRFKAVQNVATALALALALASLAAALSVLSDPAAIAAGLAPRVPADVDYGEVLPWLGFMLSGAAGIIWYSYWLRAKGYAGAGEDGGAQRDALALTDRDRDRLRGWVRQLTLDNTVAVVGTLVITIAFLVLGVELLQPRGLVPSEERIAPVLGRLLGAVWGPVGFWFMILGVFVGFWSTVLSDQDGFGRLFADGTRLLLPARWRAHPWAREALLQRAFVLVLVAALPFTLYALRGEPVALLKIAGAIEAAQLPVVAALALYLNRTRLPPGLRPSTFAFVATAFAAVFFTAFALLYVARFV